MAFLINGKCKPGKVPAARRTKQTSCVFTDDLLAFGGPDGSYLRRLERYCESFIDNTSSGNCVSTGGMRE